MAPEPQAGTVSTAQALALLLMEHPDELKKLQRDGFIKPIGRDSWRLVDLVQGFARHGRKPDAAALVSSAALAKHFDCVPAYIRKLVDAGVIERRTDDRYDQDQCRTKYLAHLREARKLSPRGAADTAFTAAKTALVELRVAERAGKLIPGVQHEARVEAIAGVLLSALSSLPAQCAPVGDLPTRRKLERWVYDVRIAISKTMNGIADAEGEPEAPNGGEVRSVPERLRV